MGNQAQEKSLTSITIHIKEVNIKSLVSGDKAVRITLDCVSVEQEFAKILEITKIKADETAMCSIVKQVGI